MGPFAICQTALWAFWIRPLNNKFPYRQLSFDPVRLPVHIQQPLDFCTRLQKRLLQLFGVMGDKVIVVLRCIRSTFYVLHF